MQCWTCPKPYWSCSLLGRGLQPPPCDPQMLWGDEAAIGNAVGKCITCFWPWQESLLPPALLPASLEAPAVSVITRLALRMFSGLSFTVTVSLYSATCSLSSGRFT